MFFCCERPFCRLSWIPLLVLIGCAGGAGPSPFADVGAVLSGRLQEAGFTCETEGRELYPIVYACTSGNLTYYLYCDDANNVEGLRALGSGLRSETDFADQVSDSIGLLLTNPGIIRNRRESGPDGRFERDRVLVEWSRSDSVELLRVTWLGAPPV